MASSGSVIVHGRHKKRLVIDYSRTVNRFTLLDAYLFRELMIKSIGLLKVAYSALWI